MGPNSQWGQSRSEAKLVGPIVFIGPQRTLMSRCMRPAAWHACTPRRTCGAVWGGVEVAWCTRGVGAVWGQCGRDVDVAWVQRIVQKALAAGAAGATTNGHACVCSSPKWLVSNWSCAASSQPHMHIATAEMSPAPTVNPSVDGGFGGGEALVVWTVPAVPRFRPRR
eukprot:365540-Chlamydomonas_euryale.AAC.6